MDSESLHPEVRLLLEIIDQAYSKPSWHGPNLKGSLRGVTAAQAGWRPAPGRHNIWEIVLHAAYWKYAVRRRLLGGRRGSFAVKGSNWFASPARVTEQSWREALEILERQHARMRGTVEAFPAARLPHPAPGSRQKASHLIAGIAAHDLYHAGQIQLLKKLQGTRRRR